MGYIGAANFRGSLLYVCVRRIYMGLFRTFVSQARKLKNTGATGPPQHLL